MNRLFACLTWGCLLALMACSLGAQTFQLTDGTTVTGEPVSPDERGVLLHLPDGSYSRERIPWAKFSDADLKKIADNPRAKPFVEPFIEASAEATVEKPEITVKAVPRLDRPTGASFLGAFLSSSLGLAVLLTLYLANLYAAYEISIFRAQPLSIVCGTAAVAPLIGPVIFLCLPTKMKTHEHEEAEMLAAQQLHAQAAATVATASAGLAAEAEQQASAQTLERPPIQTFVRGEFVFNRRFFETKFPGFFGIVRREADKDMVLTIKSARGLFTVQRFTRITANEMFVLAQRGSTVEEVSVPFVEVQEVELRHRDEPSSFDRR